MDKEIGKIVTIDQLLRARGARLKSEANPPKPVQTWEVFDSTTPPSKIRALFGRAVTRNRSKPPISDNPDNAG